MLLFICDFELAQTHQSHILSSIYRLIYRLQYKTGLLLILQSFKLGVWPMKFPSKLITASASLPFPFTTLSTGKSCLNLDCKTVCTLQTWGMCRFFLFLMPYQDDKTQLHIFKAKAIFMLGKHVSCCLKDNLFLLFTFPFLRSDFCGEVGCASL